MRQRPNETEQVLMEQRDKRGRTPGQLFANFMKGDSPSNDLPPFLLLYNQSSIALNIKTKFQCAHFYLLLYILLPF